MSRITSAIGESDRSVEGGAKYFPAKEEAGQRQEHVYSAGNPAEPNVEHCHQGDRDTAQSVQVVPVKAGRTGPHGNRGKAGSGVKAGGRGGDRVNMVDS